MGLKPSAHLIARITGIDIDKLFHHMGGKLPEEYDKNSEEYDGYEEIDIYPDQPYYATAKLIEEGYENYDNGIYETPERCIIIVVTICNDWGASITWDALAQKQRKLNCRLFELVQGYNVKFEISIGVAYG